MDPLRSLALWHSKRFSSVVNPLLQMQPDGDHHYLERVSGKSILQVESRTFTQY